MPLQESPDWQSHLDRFEAEMRRLEVPTGARGLLWDLRPEGMLFIASPEEEWYGPIEEALPRLQGLEDGAGLGAFKARFLSWRRSEDEDTEEPLFEEDDLYAS